MSDLHDAFVSKSFLRSHWDLEYRVWQDSDNEKALDVRLALWAKRTDLNETSAESAFIDVFFRETWGYVQTGQRGSETGFSLYPRFAIPGAGANGGSGEADLAIGYFSTALSQSPQALSELKGIRGALMPMRGNTRSPGCQCLDYLSFARRGMIGSEPVLPTWGIVTEAEVLSLSPNGSCWRRPFQSRNRQKTLRRTP
ncbi:MAG TPA: hypothetical protein VGP28_00105 [Methylocella sp.]|jgi:hypothetical protein|nr:hypothetical protein [Methylocella sp.]